MKEDIRKIDAYWRASNYLTVALMYLKDNIFLKHEIDIQDLKDYSSGHWGTCPGINFILSHLNYYIKIYAQRVQLTIGPGHAGNALLVHLLLEGTFQKYYSIAGSESKWDISKLQDCIAKMRTEINPFYPGTIYDGGELGYSLPVAFGTVIGKEELLNVCIIGDGEFETDTISSTWRTKLYFKKNVGKVLPILHMNGYRMSEKSILSQFSDRQIVQYFDSMGYDARIIELSHEDMIGAFKWANDLLFYAKDSVDKKWPIIVLKSPKGYSAPDTEGVHIQGSCDSHKDPISRLTRDEKVVYLQKWLDSYNPEELFLENGELKEEIKDILPQEELKLGNSLSYYERKPLVIPEEKRFNNEEKQCKNIIGIKKCIKEIMQLNKDRLIIVSPDELESNLLGELKNLDSANDCIWEVLNENICQSWMQGYILTGRNALMIGYEAFMPVISSMVSQYAKWIYQASLISWRKKMGSLNYILTSVWETNTFSHQNPVFIDLLISMQFDFTRIYMPIDANTAYICLQKCLSSENRINSIVCTKQTMPQYLNMNEAVDAVQKGNVEWENINTRSKELDLILISSGDYCVRECKEAIDILNSYIPDINIKHVTVIELTTLGMKSVYSHAMETEKFNQIFPVGVPIVFCFHGYEASIKTLLFERTKDREISILGYRNKSIHSMNDLMRMQKNGNSRYDIILRSCDYLKKYGDKIMNIKEYVSKMKLENYQSD